MHVEDVTEQADKERTTGSNNTLHNTNAPHDKHAHDTNTNTKQPNPPPPEYAGEEQLDALWAEVVEMVKEEDIDALEGELKDRINVLVAKRQQLVFEKKTMQEQRQQIMRQQEEQWCQLWLWEFQVRLQQL